MSAEQERSPRTARRPRASIARVLLNAGVRYQPISTATGALSSTVALRVTRFAPE